MTKVIKMTEDQTKIRIELPNGGEVEIDQQLNNRVHVSVYHHGTSMAHEVKLSDYTDFETISKRTSVSRCRSEFRDDKTTTVVKHVAFNK